MIHNYTLQQKEILTKYALDQKAIPARFALQKTGRTPGDAIKDVCEYFHKPMAQLAIGQMARLYVERHKLLDLAKKYYPYPRVKHAIKEINESYDKKENDIRKVLSKAPIAEELFNGTWAWNQEIEETAKSLKIKPYDMKNLDKDHMMLYYKYKKFINYEINRKLYFTLVTKTFEDHFADYMIHAIWIFDSYTGKKPQEEIFKIITTSLQQLSNQKAIDHNNAEVTTHRLEDGSYLSMSNVISSVTNHDAESGCNDIFEFLLGDATVHDTEDKLELNELLRQIKENPIVQRIMKEIQEQGLDIFCMRDTHIKSFLKPGEEDLLGRLEYLQEQIEQIRAA